MAPSFKKALKAFKKGIPESPPVPGSLNLQGLTNTAQNLPSQANKGLQNAPVRKVVPKSVAVLNPIRRTFKRHYSRLRRMVH